MTATPDPSPPSSAPRAIPLDYAPMPRLNSQRNAALALMLATVFWGCGFTWAKMGGNAIKHFAGLPDDAAFGPVFLLAWRFTIGGGVWFALFPAARRGWTWKGFLRSLGIGLLLSVALILQH